MPVGLQIINSGNIVQIDENYKNFEFKEKYSVNLILDGYFASAAFTTRNLPNEIVAIGRSDYPLRVESKGGGHYYLSSESPAQTVMVYVFAEPDQSASSSFGLQLRDEKGVVTFDSDKKYMRVVWGGQVPDGMANSPCPLVVGGLPVRDYAWVLSWPRLWWPGGLEMPVAVDATQVSSTGAVVQPAPSRFHPGNINYGFYVLYGGMLTLMDVSGL